MEPTKGYYSLLQYCPDVSRAEVANVGVLLFVPESGFVDLKVSRKNERIKNIFGRDTVDVLILNSGKRALVNRVKRFREEGVDLEKIEEFIATRANELLFSPLRPTKVEHPVNNLNALYRTLVSLRGELPHMGEKRPRLKQEPLIKDLDTFFRKRRTYKRVYLNKKISLPDFGLNIKAPYAYENGVLNLIKTVSFGNQEKKALDEAWKWAAQGGIIRSHGSDNGNESQLVVVSKRFPTSGNGLKKHISRIFKEYQTRLVTGPEIPEFLKEIERDLKVGTSLF